MTTPNEQWEQRIEVARKLGRPGDIMVLADEAPSRALRLEALRSAARALLSLGVYKLAREQCERALELDPTELESRRLLGQAEKETSLKGPELAHRQQPGQVVLFTGHMIDRPDRKDPRFPARCEPVAADAIEKVLDQLKASSADLGICGGANGGDLLFAEACLRRGMRLELRIPFEEPKFLQESVTFAGDVWRDRFYAVKANTNTTLFVMPQELGPTPDQISPYSRNNMWMLYSGLAWGDEKLSLVCLWDGGGGDGPGGTQQLVEIAQARNGRVYRLDTVQLFGTGASA